MRKLVSIFVFAAALFVGVFSMPMKTPTIYERFYPTFSEKEAKALLGKRVKNKYYSKELVGMKFSLNAETNYISEPVQVGETGEVFMLNPLPNGYGLVIKWDKKDKYGRDMFSYDGRFSSRVFLEFE